MYKDDKELILCTILLSLFLAIMISLGLFNLSLFISIPTTILLVVLSIVLTMWILDDLEEFYKEKEHKTWGKKI